MERPCLSYGIKPHVTNDKVGAALDRGYSGVERMVELRRSAGPVSKARDPQRQETGGDAQ